MIQRVYEQASRSKVLSELVIATDDLRIYDEANGFNGKAMMTSPAHRNGTERCGEVLRHFPGYDYCINIQGDEPFVHPEQIDLLGTLLDGEVKLATIVREIEDPADLDNEAIMKVIFNRQSEAIYFSRTCIPFVRDLPKAEWLKKHIFYKHIGMYGYRKDVLEEIIGLTPGNLEQAESLEQLRWMEAGYKIKVGISKHDSFGVDTPEDLLKANGFIQTLG